MTERNKNGYKLGKRYEVVKATTKPGDSVTLGDKEFKFGGNGSFYLSDSGIANELESVYGHRKGNGDVVISPVTFADQDHRYTFGTSKAFSDAWDAFEKRRQQRELVNNPQKRKQAANKRGGMNEKIQRQKHEGRDGREVRPDGGRNAQERDGTG